VISRGASDRLSGRPGAVSTSTGDTGWSTLRPDRDDPATYRSLGTGTVNRTS
jgi:hypothetical protein